MRISGKRAVNQMGHLYTSLRFSQWALEAVVMLPPLAFTFTLVGISFVWAGIKQRPFKAGLWKPHHWLAFSHLLFFVAAIAVAVFYANPVTNPTIPHPSNPSGAHCLDAITYGSLASCGFWIWRMKGFRWYAASLMAMVEVITYSALIIAGMAVTGDWL
jgi:predicted membrane-bound mannosyltransferase